MQLFVNIFSPNIMSTWFHLVRLCFVLVFCFILYFKRRLRLLDSATRDTERDVRRTSDEKRQKPEKKKESSVQTKSLDCCVIVCEWLNNVWGARLVKQCFAVGTSVLLHFQVCCCALSLYSSHLPLFISFLLALALSLARPRVYARVCTPLKWFFDMLDNEHLIMLTCVYY